MKRITYKNFLKRSAVDKWIVDPVRSFINNSTTSGIVLFSSAVLAMIVANSPWSEAYFHFWEVPISVGWGSAIISKSLHHWINDGLMAIFFFVVGLELKREIIAGELSNPAKAMLPIAAAVGGMIVPALIYIAVNHTGPAVDGWGIPMATDIAFALGVMYLLGDRVPFSLKIFLTALAIADDLGAVLVIAFFYTSDINTMSLVLGGLFLLVLIVANLSGVRSTLFYACMGIGGVWLAFLLSGVHATIASVLVAFTIPANTKISERPFHTAVSGLLDAFLKAAPQKEPTVTHEQLHILQEIRDLSKHALTPLQRLEHAMHPWVAFLVMPIFAFSNAGIHISGDLQEIIVSPVTLGVTAGLLVGKVAGVCLMVWMFTKMGWASLPEEVTFRHIIGAGFLAGVGFTMSLFISGLAFTDAEMLTQAKVGIFGASVIASLVGYFVLSKAGRIPAS